MPILKDETMDIILMIFSWIGIAISWIPVVLPIWMLVTWIVMIASGSRNSSRNPIYRGFR